MKLPALLFVLLFTAARAAYATEAGQALHVVFDDYFERFLEQNPLDASSIGDARYNDRLAIDISPAWRERALALEQDALDRAQRLDASALGAADRLSLRLFLDQRRLAIEGFAFPEHLQPINQFNGIHNLFAQLGAGGSLHPFRTVKDYDDFLRRSADFERYIDQALVNMREGMARGIVPPRVLIERALPQVQAQLVASAEDSVFWGPVRTMPAAFPATERERLTTAYRDAILTRVIPAYRRLEVFLREDYLPRCRTSAGLGALPGGADWYAYNVRAITTTSLTPERIHALGLAEVARIQDAIRGVMREVGYQGELRGFMRSLQHDPRFTWSSPQALVAGYVDIKQRVDRALPRLFARLPGADYEIRAVEPFREKSAAGGSYMAASEDGSRPGVFYANTYELESRPRWAMEALSLHEGNPGHHLQISLQREQAALPRFRRFGGYTAYIEGWGLYAESLGGELGLYTDPYQRFGMLEAELWRAIRLVVDTGLHAKGWSREQVLAYMEENSATAEARRLAEAERFMAIPGQALAYKIGQLRIRELRTRAEQALGKRFDVRRFHAAVLDDGAVPLDVLEEKIDAWIQSR